MYIAQRRLLIRGGGGLTPTHIELEKTDGSLICALAVSGTATREYLSIASDKVITAYASWYYNSVVYTAPFVISTITTDGVKWRNRGQTTIQGTNYTTNELEYHGLTFYWAIGGGLTGNQTSSSPAFKINSVVGGTYPDGYVRADIVKDILDYYFGLLD